MDTETLTVAVKYLRYAASTVKEWNLRPEEAGQFINDYQLARRKSPLKEDDAADIVRAIWSPQFHIASELWGLSADAQETILALWSCFLAESDRLWKNGQEEVGEIMDRNLAQNLGVKFEDWNNARLQARTFSELVAA
ncbi:MAG: hypothetical protein Q8P52_00250 [bacterium]|nr:hypothetical protein [bacterium]